MGILKSQSGRLLREDVWDATQLAQEIYAILNSDEPVVVDSPLVADGGNGSVPSFSVTNNFGPDGGISLRVNGVTQQDGPSYFEGPAFTINYPDGTTFNPQDPGHPNSAGPPTVQQVFFPAYTPPETPAFTPPPPYNAKGDDGPVPGTPTAQNPNYPLVAAGGGNVLVGRIVSGQGGLHRVRLYPNGFNATPGDEVDLIIPLILDSERVTPGTPIVPVVRIQRPNPGFGGSSQQQFLVEYFGQPPVWMA